MPRPLKERHQVWTDVQITRAEYFTACMFVGMPVLYDRRIALTLRRAELLAETMLAEYSGTNYGRPVAIYAVTKGDNLSIHVKNIEGGRV